MRSERDFTISTDPRGWSAFWQWEGWTAVGSIASVLALAVLVIGLWRFVVQRRQVPHFDLQWDFIATATTSGATGTFHVVEFHNFGRGAGHIAFLGFVGARAELTDGFRTPAVLGSGQTFKLLVTSPDLDKAWVRTMVRTQDDARRLMVRWAPLVRESTVGEQWKRDLDARLSRSYWDMFQDWRRPRMCAPGGVPKAVLRAGASETRIKAVSGTGSDDLINPTAPTGGPLVELAYVAPIRRS